MNSKDVVLAVIVLAMGGAGVYMVYDYAKKSQQQQQSSPSNYPPPSTNCPASSPNCSPPPSQPPPSQQQVSPFTLTFNETGLPEGKSWTVNVNGIDYYNTAPNPIVVSDLTSVSDWSAPTIYGGLNVFGAYTWKYTPTPSQGSADSTETIYITYAGSYNL